MLYFEFYDLRDNVSALVMDHQTAVELRSGEDNLLDLIWVELAGVHHLVQVD